MRRACKLKMAITQQEIHAIEQAVYNALHADKQLAGKEIAVRVTADRVILQGTVDTLAELNRARQVAAGVGQGRPLENNLSLPLEGRPGDEAVAAAIKKELRRQPALNQFRLEVTVNRGSVTLKGAVETLEQKRQVHEIASRVKGAGRIINLLDVAVTETGENG